MSCGCNTKSSCNPASSCPVALDSICVFYKGTENLDAIGGSYGTRLETLLQNINSVIQTMQEQIQDGFIGVNVGGGAEIYKGLNADNQGELRTLVSTDSIIVSQLADTISFSVRSNFINGLLDPILDRLTTAENTLETLVERMNNYDTTLSQIQATLTQHGIDIADLQTKYVNLQQDVTNLHTELNNYNQSLLAALSRISQNESDIAQLFSEISDLKAKVAEIAPVYNEEFQGVAVMAVQRAVNSIIGVYYNGVKLPASLYLFQEPSTISLQLSGAGITIDPDDIIQVTYTSRLV